MSLAGGNALYFSQFPIFNTKTFFLTHRPDTTTILLHPFFWTPARRLNFLQDASDRFEIMCRDPKDANLVALENGAQSVVGNDWRARLDKVFIENLGKYRKYDGKSVQDLMRALRNKVRLFFVGFHFG